MSRFTDISLSRDCCAVMRGMAIVAIVLHNYCHMLPGTPDENEFWYLQRHSDAFVHALAVSRHLVADVLSFAGWYGVPVFMFLTGYGLVMKYERGGAPLAPRRFLGDSFLKLFYLMLPGVVLMTATIAIAALAGGKGVSLSLFWNEALQLTMLPDVLLPLVPPSPGVYWYFGLTMQFYVIYALLIYRRPSWWMAVAVAVSLVSQALLSHSYADLAWFRHNSAGWVMILVLGVVYGRSRPVPLSLAVAVTSLSALVFVSAMLNERAWQLSLLAAVFIAVAVGRLSVLVPLWRDLWIWLGQLSPFLFAAHPVVRQWFFLAFPREHSMVQMALYLAACIAVALAYRQLWQLTRTGFRRLAPAYFG